jgi:inner membrane protein involved in colicin E2 resistance
MPRNQENLMPLEGIWKIMMILMMPMIMIAKIIAGRKEMRNISNINIESFDIYHFNNIKTISAIIT